MQGNEASRMLCASVSSSKPISESIGGPLAWGPGARAPVAHALIRYCIQLRLCRILVDSEGFSQLLVDFGIGK